MTAWLLKCEARRVALVEMRRVGEGATGYTTAKLTVGHHLIYADLAKKQGLATARAYADSNQWAIERLEQLVSENRINCDWERAANFIYTEDEQWLSDLRGEVEAMRRAGISAELTRPIFVSPSWGRSGSTRKRSSIRANSFKHLRRRSSETAVIFTSRRSSPTFLAATSARW